MFQGEVIELGEFGLTTPVMRVSAPCYNGDVDLAFLVFGD